ncbi:MAG TPA: SEC-C metal-binding domain-containing protein [Gemmataceae bacterium]|nr:SEC-C metal-binding domain-containing protein [Gemmataceae bacterium]
MISWVAMERIYEREVQRDAKLRKQAGARPLRVHAQHLSDEELLARLRSFGIEIDRDWLERNCERALSAEEIAQPLLDRSRSRGQQSDWIWICIAALWRRWFPEQPSFEELDDKMQAGYERLASRHVAAACRIWLEAWNDVVRLLDKAGIESIADFDERFGGTQSLFNWIQDMESELWNAGLDDRQFLSARIALCEEGLRRFPSGDDLMIENRRRALAESYFELGETEKAEALYQEWLDADPCWGWGWIGWSDCYRFTRTEPVDLNRCEQILREGFAIAAVRDRADIADRLAEVCEEQGRDAKESRRQSERRAATVEVSRTVSSAGKVLRQKTQVNFGGAGLPLSEMSNLTGMLSEAPTKPVTRQKVGRNEPCPCGSGKKFKKCCGA